MQGRHPERCRHPRPDSDSRRAPPVAIASISAVAEFLSGAGLAPEGGGVASAVASSDLASSGLDSGSSRAATLGATIGAGAAAPAGICGPPPDAAGSAAA